MVESTGGLLNGGVSGYQRVSNETGDKGRGFRRGKQEANKLECDKISQRRMKETLPAAIPSSHLFLFLILRMAGCLPDFDQ
eukprot:768729-Hanusia_phi.AAC.1